MARGRLHGFWIVCTLSCSQRLCPMSNACGAFFPPHCLPAQNHLLGRINPNSAVNRDKKPNNVLLANRNHPRYPYSREHHIHLDTYPLIDRHRCGLSLKKKQLAKASRRLSATNATTSSTKATRRQKRFDKLQEEVAKYQQSLVKEGYRSEGGASIPKKVYSPRQPATKQISVSRWPRALCIHIRRNHMARATGVMRVRYMH